MAKTINQFQRESRMDCYAENAQLRAENAALAAALVEKDSPTTALESRKRCEMGLGHETEHPFDEETPFRGDRYVRVETYLKLRAYLVYEREKVKLANDVLASERGIYADRLAAAQATIEQMRDLLDDCVNSLANYKLLQRRSNDPIGAEVTAKEISSIKSVLTIASNLDALHEARARECERLKTLSVDGNRRWVVSDWLEQEAAAHRAKKGEKK